MASSRAVAKGSEVGMVSQVSPLLAGGASPGAPRSRLLHLSALVAFLSAARSFSEVCLCAPVARASPLLLSGRPGHLGAVHSHVPPEVHMRVSTVLHAGCFLALAGLAACADQPATEPSDVGAPVIAKRSSGSGGDPRRPPAADPDQHAPGARSGRTSGSARPRCGTRPRGTTPSRRPRSSPTIAPTHRPTSGCRAIRGGMAGSASPTPWTPSSRPSSPASAFPCR